MKSLRPLFFLLLCVAFSQSLYAQKRLFLERYIAILSADQEEVPQPLPGVGYALLTLDRESQRLDYMVVVYGASGPIESAHFHTGALGKKGEIVRHITFQKNLASIGTWTNVDPDEPLTIALLDSLYRGKLYVNVHTMANPQGEIRGQFFRAEDAAGAFAESDQETPSTGEANAKGAAIFLFDTTNHAVFYNGSVSHLTSGVAAAHIHKGTRGTPGGIVRPTPFSPASYSTTGVLTGLTMDQFDRFRDSSYYWNIHTTAHPVGEIRGQIESSPAGNSTGTWFFAMLSGPQEGADGIPSTATGTAIMFLNEQGNSLHVIAVADSLSGPIIFSHIHRGDALTFNGDVVKPFAPNEFGANFDWSALDANQPLTKDDITNLMNGKYYINLHTTKFPNGEIRGQILPASNLNVLASVSRNAGHTLVAYPNPASTHLTISGFEGSSLSFSLVDMLGKERWRGQIASGMNIPLANIPAGAYILRANGVSIPVTIER